MGGSVVRQSGTTKSEARRSEEHTSELQSLRHLVCRLLLEKNKYRSDEAVGYLALLVEQANHFGFLNDEHRDRLNHGHRRPATGQARNSFFFFKRTGAHKNFHSFLTGRFSH